MTILIRLSCVCIYGGGGGGGGGTRLADLNTCTVVLFMFVHFFNAGNHSIDQGEKYCCF